MAEGTRKKKHPFFTKTNYSSSKKVGTRNDIILYYSISKDDMERDVEMPKKS